MSVRVIARSLRQLAAQLESGRYDRAEMHSIAPTQQTGSTYKLMDVLSVHIIAWRGQVEETDDKEKDDDVQVPA